MYLLSINDIEKNPLISGQPHFKSLNLLANYYREYYQEKFTDLSFAIIQDDVILGYIVSCVLEKKLSLPEGGVIIELFDEKHRQNKSLYIEILNNLELLAKKYECEKITIKDSFNNGCLSILGEHLFNCKYESYLTFEMEIDYKNFDLAYFHKNLRKSYKSLINWGRKNLQVTNINKEAGSFEVFKEFQDFHLKIAGLKTRSDKSWQTQYEMVKDGFGELILARYKDKIVAGSLFADYGNTSVYFTGVYERDLFQFGVSHFLLYEGIYQSYIRNNTSRFSLGYFNTNIKDPKWYNIQFFKKGFCEKLKPTIFWSKELN